MEWKRKQMPAEHDPWDGEWEGEHRGRCYEMFIFSGNVQCECSEVLNLPQCECGENHKVPYEHDGRFFVEAHLGANYVVVGPLDHEQPIEHGHAWAKSMIDDWHNAKDPRRASDGQLP